MKFPAIGSIGFGEAGCHLAKGLRGAGAVKMCRSIVVKGMEEPIFECVLSAGHYGADEWAFASPPRRGSLSATQGDRRSSFPGVRCVYN